MTPLVTVGVPFHDEAQYLGAAVRSILAQEERDLEVLLVDDGSEDGSLEIARSFLSDPRVRVLSDGVRRTLPARLNEIVREARGAFVARMDGDDVSHPRRLVEQLALLRSSGVDAVGATVALVDDAERTFAVMDAPAQPVSERMALERGTLPHATLLASRAWFRAHPYDERLSRAEDRDLWVRTARDSRFDAVRDVRYVVRVTPRSPGFLAGYVDGQRQLRSILLRHGPRTFGLARTARVALATTGKLLAMRVAFRAGLAPMLVARRGRPPTLDDQRAVAEALSAASP